MTTRKSLYDILGVKSDATQDQIRAAYRLLAMKHHPDRAGAGADEELFKEVQAAYDVLKAPASRAVYDDTGDAPKPSDEENALSEVLGLMQSIIDGNTRPERFDLCEMAVNHVLSRMAGLETDKANVKAKRTKYTKLKKRFKIKDSEGGTTPFEEMILHNIKGCSSQLEVMEKIITRGHLMIKILRGYEFNQEIGPDDEAGHAMYFISHTR